MLGSFNSEEDDHSDLQYRHRFPPPSGGGFTSQAIHMRQLLIRCAQLLSQSDYAAAHRLVALLCSNSSPYGATSTERVGYQFAKALSLRLNSLFTSNPLMMNAKPMSPSGSSRLVSELIPTNAAADFEALQSCYLSLNQVTPFVRFSHLTANQAILEAMEGHPAIHILDFNIMHGVQWPPLMQALAERADPIHPPMLRITGAGHDFNILHKTGDRLLKFAQSLGLKFQFHPLLYRENDPTSISLYPDETLAVNCIFNLHSLLKDDSRDDLWRFLHKIKALNPKIVTVAEREASHNHPLFFQRFVEAVDHYTAIFDSLEATLPPSSKERLAVEQMWFGKEIMDIVAEEGDNRKERHERFEWWEVMLRSTGFNNVPLSPFALSQAKLLLRLHYPSEGYQLQSLKNSFFLGWQNRALFSVSSWQ